MIQFPFNENRFSFFVADNLLVGQLCTNPKSDRSLYHVWKCHNVQRARSEMRRCTTHDLYRSKLWQQNHCQHTQKAISGPGCAEECGDSLVADPGCSSRTRRRPTSPKRPRLGFWRKDFWRKDFVPFSHWPPPPSTWTRWTTTLNRCQLYYIIKLPELIFSIKVLK